MKISCESLPITYLVGCMVGDTILEIQNIYSCFLLQQLGLLHTMFSTHVVIDLAFFFEPKKHIILCMQVFCMLRVRLYFNAVDRFQIKFISSFLGYFHFFAIQLLVWHYFQVAKETFIWCEATLIILQGCHFHFHSSPHHHPLYSHLTILTKHYPLKIHLWVVEGYHVHLFL